MNQIVLLGQVKCAKDIISDLQEQFQRNVKGKGCLEGIQARM